MKASRTLFIVATYTIGKEKILLRIADQCKCKIVVDKRKMKILECLELMEPEMFEQTFTLDSVSALWSSLGSVVLQYIAVFG